MYPLKLDHISKAPIWSGNKLISEWGFDPGSEKLGEAWVLSVRELEKCRVLNGENAGKTLEEVIGVKDFPLLIKLIDAKTPLSVQVHPDDAYTQRHNTSETHGKTEMWYILNADEGAEIIYGLADNVGAETFAEGVREGKTEQLVKHIPAKAGDVFFIPAGLVHAIGGGITLAEVQQNCDLTFRVYDYGRFGNDGKPRQLHIDEAIEVAREFSKGEIDAIRFSEHGCADIPEGAELIAACKFFTVYKLDIKSEIKLPKVYPGEFSHILCLDGAGKLLCGGAEYEISRGESYYLSESDVSVTGNASLFVTVGRFEK